MTRALGLQPDPSTRRWLGRSLVVLAAVSVVLGARFRHRLAANPEELERRPQLRDVLQVVHDSGSGRLAQVLMIARDLRRRPDLPECLSGHLDALIEVAGAGVSELREVMGRSSPRAPVQKGQGRLETEWGRSIRTLRSAGFDVAQVTSVHLDLPPAIEAEASRVTCEAVSNICKHAVAGSRVFSALAADGDQLVLSWQNDALPAPSVGRSIATGLGLRGMERRVTQLGGEIEHHAIDGVFRLRVVLPLDIRVRTGSKCELPGAHV